MYPSANRHVLAILRRHLGGIEQHRLAKWAGCSVETIRKIEKGKLKLSESLAMRISDATNISLTWLIENDLTSPPTTQLGEPFTKATFEQWQAAKQQPYSPTHDVLLPTFLFCYYEIMRRVLQAASKEKKDRLVIYRLSSFFFELREEFIGPQASREPAISLSMLDLAESDAKTSKEYWDLILSDELPSDLPLQPGAISARVKKLVRDLQQHLKDTPNPYKAQDSSIPKELPSSPKRKSRRP